MKKKSFIRVFGMLMLLMMCSVALNAQPRANISDHLDPAVLVNPGDTIKKDVLNYLNDKGRDDTGWRRGFMYVKNGGSIYVDMRHLSQFDHWRNGEPNPVVKIDPVLDQRGSTIHHYRYVDKSGKSQDLELVVIPYNVPMLHSKGAVYELDPRSTATLPTSLTELKMAREPINAFYEYRITEDNQLNDYITVQDPAQGKTGIRGSIMSIDYRMPTPEAPYDMRDGELEGYYDFDKGVSIAQLRAIAQLYPHTEASNLDPNAHGIDSLDFTVRISSRAIAGVPSRYLSNESGGKGYFTYIRVIDQRRKSLSLEPNISLVGYKYTPLNIPFASASRVEVRANGRPLNESKFSIRDKVNLSFNIQNDPNNMYHFYRIATKSGRLIYQYGETSLNGQSSNTVYQKLSTDFTVSGEDDVFLVTLCRWKSSFTVQSNDPSLGQAFFVDQENYPYSSVRGGGRNRLVLAEGEYFYPILKPSDNAIFRGWRIGNSDKILTTIGDLTPYFTIGTQNFVEKENDYLWTLLNPNNEDVVDLSLTAVFERNAPAKATLSVGVSAGGSGTVSINGETQTSITVDQGTTVVLEAQANEGYVFSHWKNSEGRQVGTTVKLTYKVEKDETLIAVFDKNAPAKATLSVGAGPEKSGSVLINGETQTSITVEQGKEVSLEAQANKGYNFSHWKNSEGRQVGTTAKLTYKVEKDETLTAVFDKNAPAKATLTVGVSPEKSGSVSINGEAQTSITIEQGKEVSLEAQANKGYNFSHWKNSEGRQVGTTAKLTYKVEKDETLTAVFEAKITPRVDEVKVLTGQRDAILTWDAGSATSWQIKLYQAGQILGNPIVTQVPRVELGNLKPGQGYTYEIFARSQGMLDSEAKKATFTTEKFNEAEAITPYLKGFSQFRGGQAFDLIWMDVNPTEFVSETPIYRYYWQATPTSELVPLTPSGKQLTLDANRRGGRLIVKILSGNDQLYEIGYDLNQ